MERESSVRTERASKSLRWATSIFLLAVCSSCGRDTPTTAEQGADDVGSVEDNEDVQRGVVLAMSGGSLHAGPHMELTALRPETEGDDARARELLATLRDILAKYEDVDAARRDGYTPFLPNIEQQEYHFTNVGRTLWAALVFDPAKPSSLLYEKRGDGWKLTGAMYTAPARASREELDSRVPLSYAHWHVHVNICVPPLDMLGDADWTRFGPRGSIATREACSEAGGRFLPQIFGWMVHVYPFENDPDAIWGR